MIHKLAQRGLFVAALIALAGCNTVVMNPSGDIAQQQSHLIVVSTAADAADHRPGHLPDAAVRLALSQKQHRRQYEPDWDHSTRSNW
jgi:cytochrome o ubiquinol oxidase subunit 2